MPSLILGPDLEALKTQLMAEIDAGAEKVRGRFITLGEGQSLVYVQKLREAELISLRSAYDEGSGEVVTSVSKWEVPNLAVEAEDQDVTLLAIAATVLSLEQEWSMISSGIEKLRLSHKRQVAESTTVAAAYVAAKVDWSSLTPAA